MSTLPRMSVSIAGTGARELFEGKLMSMLCIANRKLYITLPCARFNPQNPRSHAKPLLREAEQGLVFICRRIGFFVPM